MAQLGQTLRRLKTRFAVVVLGDRLTAAVVEGHRVETFVVEAENPAGVVRGELEARRLAPRTVAIGLSRASVTVKPIKLPPVVGELRDMVRFELERHLPFPADEAPFDFIPLPAEGDEVPGDAHRVLIAAADRRVLEAALRIAEEANLRPVSVTVAAHDLLTLVHAERRERVVWLHRTGDATDLLFLVGGAIVLSRNVPSTDEGLIAAEIRRSLPVARWRGLDAMWVSGDGAAPERAATTPLGQLGAPITEPPYTASARSRLAGLDGDTRGARELAVAVASARGARPLDLIPPALKPRRLTRPQLVTFGMGALALLLALAALLVPGYVQSRRLAGINAEIARIDPEVRAVERVLGERDRKRTLLATIDALESSAIRPLPVLRELTELLPNDAWLTTLSLDPKGIELTGQAAAAAALIPLLENSPRFERVEFASPVTRGRDREQFRIRAAWETPPGRPEPPPAATVPPAPGAGTPSVPGVGAPRPPAGAEPQALERRVRP